MFAQPDLIVTSRRQRVESYRMTVPSPMRRSTARDQGYYPGINRRCYRIETPTC
ncbi:hypothetical protein BD311DRAFT_758556 [Dichomitus squalens]|uniref:Uncharacterized protein n=1 Tax=Dichomitus squalens TaxID=114155 RepID=A0A4Q9MQG1_9APHY|nr:hypothetical protein BD311DRAFT_758556 [Dichomitus squalens]